MKREHLARPTRAALSPDHGAPPELAALTANVRARIAFWAGVHARDVVLETGAVITRAAVVLTREALTAAASAADSADAAALGTNGADAIAARVIRRTVESIAPPKMVRAVLQRPSLAWRYPFNAVRDDTGEPAAVAAAWLDRAAVVRGVVDIPAHLGAAERVKLPPRHAVAMYGAAEPPPEALQDATRCIPLAALAPPVTVGEVLAALRSPSAPREARDAADVIERHAIAATDPSAELGAAGLAPWGPHAVGAVLCTLREIRDVHGPRRDSFAFPTTQESNAAVNHLAAPAKPGAWKSSAPVTLKTRRPEDEAPSRRKRVLRVQWEGKMLPVQLCLELTGDATEEAVAAVLDNMADDGLRDWLALHALADEQGNTGDVRWTWEAHKRVALYSPRADAAARTAEGRETDDALRAAVIRRLWQFTRAALWEDFGEGRKMRRVGDGPFARIVIIGDPAGLREEPADFTHVGITINRELYRGAHRDAKGEHRHFTSIPRAVFKLRGAALRLAVFLLRAERMNRDAGMGAELTERKLMQYARIHGGAPTAKQMPAARAELARCIAAVTEAMNDGETPGSLAAMTPDPARPGVYRWTPARWRVEREHLGLAPDRPALPPSDRPYTGGALRAWREARGLLQRDAARLLKVGEATVKRAEQRPDDPLPRSFHRAGLAWGMTAGDAARQLGAGAPGPVEGEDDPDAADDTAA